jgi:hypothetical protein
MDAALGHHREDRGELPRLARHLDALEGGVFRQAQLLDAVVAHRRKSGRNEQPAHVDLGDVRQELRRRRAILRDARLQSAEQFVIVEMSP